MGAYEMKCSRADARNSDEKLAEFSSFFSFFFFFQKEDKGEHGHASKEEGTDMFFRATNSQRTGLVPSDDDLLLLLYITRYIT